MIAARLRGFADEVVRAELHRRHRVLDGAVRGHHQDLDLGGDRLDRLEQILARHARHAQVGDHHLHRVQAQDVERLLAALGHPHVHVLLREHLLQRVEDARLVVHDEHGGEWLRRQGHGWLASLARSGPEGNLNDLAARVGATDGLSRALVTSMGGR
jgi:hypothetical protein